MSLLSAPNAFFTASTGPVAAELLHTTSTDTNANDYTTSSITFGGGTNACFLLGMVFCDPSNDSVDPSPVVTGGGMTWTRAAADVAHDGGGGFMDVAVVVYRASGTPSDGALTISDCGVGGASVDGMRAILIKLTNVDNTTNNGVVQSAINTGTTSASVTLAAFADATNNLACGFFGAFDAAAGTITQTVGSGFTAVGAGQQAMDTATVSLMFEHKTGQDLGVDATVLAASDWMGGIALEINALA